MMTIRPFSAGLSAKPSPSATIRPVTDVRVSISRNMDKTNRTYRMPAVSFSDYLCTVNRRSGT